MYFDTLQQEQDYAADIALDNWKADQCERAYYRERELDLFFDWYFTRLDDIIRRDPSEAYEAFHERRLAVGLTEDQVAVERTRYFERKKMAAHVASQNLPF